MRSSLGLPAASAIVWLVLCLTAAAADNYKVLITADNYKVVVNAANPVTSHGPREVSALFLRRATSWADGIPALPVDGPDSPARESFCKDVHGKKSAAVRSYWLQIIFSGRGVPPPEKPSDQDVIACVKANRGAIGYVSASEPTDAVKVLKIAP